MVNPLIKKHLFVQLVLVVNCVHDRLWPWLPRWDWLAANDSKVNQTDSTMMTKLSLIARATRQQFSGHATGDTTISWILDWEKTKNSRHHGHHFVVVSQITEDGRTNKVESKPVIRVYCCFSRRTECCSNLTQWWMTKQVEPRCVCQCQWVSSQLNLLSP